MPCRRGPRGWRGGLRCPAAIVPAWRSDVRAHRCRASFLTTSFFMSLISFSCGSSVGLVRLGMKAKNSGSGTLAFMASTSRGRKFYFPIIGCPATTEVLARLIYSSRCISLFCMYSVACEPFSRFFLRRLTSSLGISFSR